MSEYTVKELEAMLAEPESHLSERKRDFTGDVPAKVRKTVCAFANDIAGTQKRGVIFIGANDDGSPSNFPITDQLMLSLSDMARDGNILPLPVISVRRVILLQSEMVVIEVTPSDTPPVSYKGIIYVRTGSRLSTANAQEERILNERRLHTQQPFEMRATPRTSIADLSEVVFRTAYLPKAVDPEILQENGRSLAEQLASCKMITAPEENASATNLGMLLLGNSTQEHLGGAYIQFLRIDGDKLSDEIIDAERLEGNIISQLTRIKDKLLTHNRVAYDITSAPTHKTTETYPIAAVMQIVYNAICHRTYESANAPVHVYWYNNRIEVTSPGGPFGNVTINNFGRPGIVGYRNQNLAASLRILNFVQSFGRGITLARELMNQAGHPEIEFDVSESAVICKMWRKL